jgi:pimeloyl-ACP methyl ester carboxylesterase
MAGKTRSMTLLIAPSLGRGADDLGEITGRLADLGHRVFAPQPLGVDDISALEGADLADLARHYLAGAPHDGGPIIAIGHAYGNWVARMAAVLAPERVKAVILLAAARRVIPADIKVSLDGSFDQSLSEDERLAHLQRAFFAPGHDAREWLEGWYPQLAAGQRLAAARSDRSLWWHAGDVSILDVQAAQDAISPIEQAGELRLELGSRVQCVTIENAGHALLPEQPDAVAEAIDRFVRQVQQKI